jgi:hypothetical protein
VIGTTSFVLVADGLTQLAPTLRALFTHPWVASYQIGFGPPLVRSSDRIIERVRGAKSALEKLDAYLDVCVLNEPERRRLNALHRTLTVRRLGPVEAEALDESSAEALDLGLRLHNPGQTTPALHDQMRNAGVTFDMFVLNLPPDALSARVHLRLADPRGERLLHVEEVRNLADNPDVALALELRVPPKVQPLYAVWLDLFERHGRFKVAFLGDPTSHARVSSDGSQR